MKTNISAPETSSDPNNVLFARKQEIREKIIQKWLCADHSLPDKPTACWRREDEPGVCYPLMIGNINYWAARIVSYSCFADNLLVLMGRFTDFRSWVILGEWETITAQSHVFPPFVAVQASAKQSTSTTNDAVSVLSNPSYVLSSKPLACELSVGTVDLTAWFLRKLNHTVKVSQRSRNIHLAALLRLSSKLLWQKLGCSN